MIPPPRGGPNLMGLLPETYFATLVTGIGVPGRGLISDQPLGSLFTPPLTEHNSDPVGGEPTVPQVLPV